MDRDEYTATQLTEVLASADNREGALLHSEMPMVCCMPGRPGVIVMTTAARDSQ